MEIALVPSGLKQAFSGCYFSKWKAQIKNKDLVYFFEVLSVPLSIFKMLVIQIKGLIIFMKI